MWETDLLRLQRPPAARVSAHEVHRDQHQRHIFREFATTEVRRASFSPHGQKLPATTAGQADVSLNKLRQHQRLVK